ncbi:MAG: glycosyltransferase [Cyanobacteria bacterium J069]|nr:MAG: glycosyltransferase [Cyanobacteria bacterium J069]
MDVDLEKFASDSRLELIRLPLSPPGAIRNQALQHVRLPWVAYCDGDDIWYPGKTQVQRSYADETNSDFVGADHYLVDERGSVRAFALARNIPMPSSWLVRTEVMRSHPFNASLPQGSDGEWWIRTTGKIRKRRCAKLLLGYRVRAGSVSSSTPSKRRKAKIVKVAGVPILREFILSATWVIWFTTRKTDYMWLNSWGVKPTES